MNDSPQHNFGATELDPDLLATPFGVQTNWHVITGAPSCGKTTLIDQLAAKEFQTVPETAHRLIEREMARGRTIDDLRKNWVAIQRPLVDMQLEIEDGLRASDVIFLDRAVPDLLAFRRAYGLNPNDILADCFHHRYASVFILDRLPFKEDGVRDEDGAFAACLDEWHTRDYSALGYNVVRVPVSATEERVAFILERLCEQGLI